MSGSPQIPKWNMVRPSGTLVGIYRGTRDKETIFRTNSTRGLELYVDADFVRNWDMRNHMIKIQLDLVMDTYAEK